MTATERFIEDAINGGWNDQVLMTEPIYAVRRFGQETATRLVHSKILLDPLAWQAVGKTRGWNSNFIHSSSANNIRGWGDYWHRFIDHLADRKDIDEALSLIEK